VKAEFPLAIVTGAARRLGRSLALTLARRGFGIILHYHTSVEDAQATAEELRSLNVPVWPVQADLTDPEQIRRLFIAVDETGFPLQVLVNSASIMQAGDARNLSLGEWDRTIDLNLRAPFLCAQQAAGRMGNGGLIVNLTDVGASKTWSGVPVYTVSKAGLESLTRVLACTLAPDIRVNAIAPGLVLPSDETDPQDWQRLVERLPLRRPASLQELSTALEYLLDNPYVTGQTITVDGGYSLL
jgi:pteridine reductase